VRGFIPGFAGPPASLGSLSSLGSLGSLGALGSLGTDAASRRVTRAILTSVAPNNGR